VNFTGFKNSWKADGIKNPKPEKLHLFLKPLIPSLGESLCVSLSRMQAGIK